MILLRFVSHLNEFIVGVVGVTHVYAQTTVIFGTTISLLSE